MESRVYERNTNKYYVKYLVDGVSGVQGKDSMLSRL